MDLSGLSGLKQKADNGPMSMVNTAFDLLSRPLYAVTKTAKEVVEAFNPQTAAPGEDTSFLANARDIVTAPVRGLLATDEDGPDGRNNLYTSQLLEFMADRIQGKNPGYVDQENNVNPIVKGVAGFAGDVALDPLTYIPGGLIVKGAKGAKNLVTGAAGAVKGALPAAKAAEKAVADEAITAINAFDPVNYSPTADLVGSMQRKVSGAPGRGKPELADDVVDESGSIPLGAGAVPEPKRPSPADLQKAFADLPDKLDVPGITTKVTKRQAQDAFLAVSSGKKVTPRRKAIYEHVVQSSTKVDNVVEAASAAVQRPRTGQDFFDELKVDLQTHPERKNVSNFLKGLTTDVKAGAVGATAAERAAATDATLSTWFQGKGLNAGNAKIDLDRQLTKQGDSGREVLAKLWEQKTGQALDPASIPGVTSPGRLAQMDAEGGPLARFVAHSLLTQPGFRGLMSPELQKFTQATFDGLVEQQKALGAGTAVTSTLEAFAARASQGQAVDILGKPLTEWLLKQSPTKFDSIRRKLVQALAPGTDLAEWAALAATRDDITKFTQLLRHLGLAPARSDLAGAITRVKEAAIESSQGARLHTAGEIASRAWFPNYTNVKEAFPTKVTKGVRRSGDSAATDTARRLKESNASMNYELTARTNDAFWGKRTGKTVQRAWAAEETLRVANAMRPAGAKPFTSVRDPALSGTLRARVDAELKLNTYKDLDELNDAVGIRSFISQPGKYSENFGLSGAPIALSLGDIYGITHRIAEEAGMGGMTLRNLFGAASSVAPTAYQGAWARLIEMGDNVDVQEIAAMLGSTASTRLRGKPMPNHFAEKQIPELDWHWPNKRMTKDDPSIQWNATGTRWRHLEDGEAARLKMAEFMASDEVLGAMKTRLAENTQAYIQRVGKETHKLSTLQLSAIDAFVVGGKRQDAYEAIVKARSDLRRRANDEGMIPSSAELATDLVEGAVGDAGVGLAHASMSAVGKVNATAGATTATTFANDTRSIGQELAESTLAKQLDDAQEQHIGRALTQATKTQKMVDEVDAGTKSLDEALEAEMQAAFLKQKDDLNLEEMARRSAAEKHTGEVGVLAFGSHQRVQDGVSGLLGGLRKMFVQADGMETLNPVRQAWENASGYFVSRQHRSLDALAKKYPLARPGMTDGIWPAVWEAFRKGTAPLDETLAGPYAEFAEIMGRVLPTTADANMLDNVVLANGDIALLERLMKENGLDDIVKGVGGPGGAYFDLDAAKALSKQTGEPLGRVLANQWRQWDVTNPLDFGKRFSNVVATATEWRQMAAQFVTDGRKLGWVSDEARPGFVKAEPSAGTAYGAFIDPNVYYAEPMLKELVTADKFATMPKMVQNRLVRNYYLPLLRMWKFDITQLRPGHHIRNFVGDSSITYVARGGKDYLRSGQEAIAVLFAHRDYRGVDALGTLQGAGVSKTPKGMDVIVRGAKDQFTIDEIYDAAMKRGLMPSVYIGEDLMMEGGVVQNRFAQVTDKLSLRTSAVGKKVGDWSEARDHFARMHHFVQALHQEARKGKYADKEALFDQLSKEVRKYHPDASMLSNFETKYMRLIIPFYTWFRGILPAIAESSMRYPGRIMQFPKASFNLAVGNGLNPESLANPYPEDDQLFPSFITKSALGPQAMLGENYVAMNPGFSHIDVYNLLGTDPFRGVLGMLSPFIRIPAELSTGGMMSTGGRIQDTSDYIDSSIPGVNYIANITGVSPSGSLAGLLSGTGFDPQRQVASGSKTGLDQFLSGANWVTGMGLGNLSKESYINYAEIEKRDRESE